MVADLFWVGMDRLCGGMAGAVGGGGVCHQAAFLHDFFGGWLVVIPVSLVVLVCAVFEFRICDFKLTKEKRIDFSV